MITEKIEHDRRRPVCRPTPFIVRSCRRHRSRRLDHTARQRTLRTLAPCVLSAAGRAAEYGATSDMLDPYCSCPMHAVYDTRCFVYSGRLFQLESTPRIQTYAWKKWNLIFKKYLLVSVIWIITFHVQNVHRWQTHACSHLREPFTERLSPVRQTKSTELYF